MCLTAKSRSKSLPWTRIFSRQPVKNCEPTSSSPSPEKQKYRKNSDLVSHTAKLLTGSDNSFSVGIFNRNCFHFFFVFSHVYLDINIFLLCGFSIENLLVNSSFVDICIRHLILRHKAPFNLTKETSDAEPTVPPRVQITRVAHRNDG